MSVEARVVKGGLAFGAANAVRAAVMIVGHSIVLPRLLDPAAFGLLGMVVATVGIVSILSDPGLSRATLQAPRFGATERNDLFWLTTGIGVLLCALTVGMAPLVVRWFGYPILAALTIAFAGIGLLQSLTHQHRATLARELRFTTLATIETIAVILELTSAILLALRGAGVWALVVGRATGVSVRLFGCWGTAGWIPGRPGFGPDSARMLAFGGRVTGFNLFNFLARNVDDLAIGRAFGQTPLGLYRRAYDVYLVPRDQISAPIGRVALAALCRLVDEPDRYRRLYTRLVQTGLALSLPISVWLLFFADWLIPVLLGEPWRPTVPLFRALAPLMLAEPLLYPTGWLFMSQDRTDEMLRWGIWNALLCGLLVVAGLPWGPLGVAVAYAGGGLLVRLPLLFAIVGSRGPVPTGDLWRLAIPFLAPTTLMAATCATLRVAIDSLPSAAASAALLAPLAALAATASTRSGRVALLELTRTLRGVLRGERLDPPPSE